MSTHHRMLPHDILWQYSNHMSLHVSISYFAVAAEKSNYTHVVWVITVLCFNTSRSTSP